MRFFKKDSLKHKFALPKPPGLGKADFETNGQPIRVHRKEKCEFADVLAVQPDSEMKNVLVLYSDKMVTLFG